jgi:hypothetical protein
MGSSGSVGVLAAAVVAGVAVGITTVGSATATRAEARAAAPLVGEFFDRTRFRNPYGHIPAQCYIETSHGTQNACLFCHTNGVYLRGLGNNNPQAGHEPLLGNLQLEYAFAALRYPYAVNGSVVPWENTLHPTRLRETVAAQGIEPDRWDMQTYVRQDNWRAAFAQRPGSPLDWDSGIDGPFRLLPGLDPADLPAGEDGFVRSAQARNGWFRDAGGWVTGWRAIDFVPYGIFTPLTGSVSGIYVRLPAAFMRDASGVFDLSIYRANLDLLERAIQDRLRADDPAHYHGAASGVPVRRGLYPIGTELAHPLHYVDTAADGRDLAVSPFPGTRSRRVKEIRYLYKHAAFEPAAVRPGEKVEDAPLYASPTQGWTDNGAGWYLAGFIEDAGGTLRPQTPAELVQCVGCHSGNAPQSRVAHAEFASGTGNTVDSTWSLPRKHAGDAGWREASSLGYAADPDAAPDALPGRASRGDPLNRALGVGELRLFLEHVVGASLYGDMPASVEAFLATRIGRARGYSADWPAVDTGSPEALAASQRLRQRLMRELTARREHLAPDGTVEGALLYPPRAQALAGAARYRQVVATQRYDLGKDVFAATPFTYRYYRTAETSFARQDGSPYAPGDVITERPIDADPVSLTHGVGVGETLIDPGLPRESGGTYLPDYVPLLADPPAFEAPPSEPAPTDTRL